MQEPISITSIFSVSALGMNSDEIWQAYLGGKSLFSERNGVVVSEVTSEIEQQIKILQQSKSAYKNLDRSVLLALLASREVGDLPSLQQKNMGINMGSSRGATGLFEKYYKQFQEEDRVSAYSSPTTTLGNISSWVGQYLGWKGVKIEHSVTCSTAMHALLNGIAWLQADMADAFLVGGSEAALTPFTISQMQALKLYSTSVQEWPCESMNFKKKRNTMVLGEGAAVAILEKGITEKTRAVISGYGYASERLVHNSSISENADCFQKSMKMALDKAGVTTVDAIIMHAPGTVKGDQAEKNAINKVFGKQVPQLTSNKWLLGHTFGASGMMSIEMAVLMLQHDHFVANPFYENPEAVQKSLKTILINAVGFGGNAVSIVLSKHVSLPH